LFGARLEFAPVAEGKLDFFAPIFEQIFIPAAPLAANHSSVSDKKSIALWYSGLRSFGRRKSGARGVDTVPDFMRFAVMRHAGRASGALRAKLSGRVVGVLILVGKF